MDDTTPTNLRFPFRVPYPDAAAERIPRQVAAGKRFVDQHGVRVRKLIRRTEVAALEQANSHRPWEAAANLVAGNLNGGAWRAVYTYRLRLRTARVLDRFETSPRYRGYSGQRRDPVSKLVQVAGGLWGGVLEIANVRPGDQNSLYSVAGIHMDGLGRRVNQ
jgi:hypothetical protein